MAHVEQQLTGRSKYDDTPWSQRVEWCSFFCPLWAREVRVQYDICRPAVKLLVIKGRLTDTVWFNDWEDCTLALYIALHPLRTLCISYHIISTRTQICIRHPTRAPNSTMNWTLTLSDLLLRLLHLFIPSSVSTIKMASIIRIGVSSLSTGQCLL